MLVLLVIELALQVVLQIIQIRLELLLEVIEHLIHLASSLDRVVLVLLDLTKCNLRFPTHKRPGNEPLICVWLPLWP